MIPFHCPLCGLALGPVPGSLKCEKGHTFDLAREGYCNLLLVQQKASLDPGDNKEMVEARRRFLAAGHFAPIAGKLAEQVRALKLDAPRILDAGCGDGYYTAELKKSLPGSELAGIDISKWAVKAAAKCHKEIAWAVASSKQLPFAPNSLDLVLCLFGFPFWESFRTVLKAKGHVLLVDPAPAHLLELRERIYKEVKATDLSGIEGALAAGFRLESEEQLDFTVTLEGSSAIADLLAMTPHGYRIKAEARAALLELPRLTTRASVAFRWLRLG